jgi:sorbitol-specific phosphotransferase system component IIBC
MQCKGTTQSGRQCQKKVEDGYCSQHESQRVEEVEEVAVEEESVEEEAKESCARCGPEKESIQDVTVGY